MAAQIAAAIYNTGFKSPKNQVSPLDLMPSQWAKKHSKKAKHSGRMTKKQKRQELSTSLNMAVMQIMQEAAKVIRR
jgi:hypothetical protein